MLGVLVSPFTYHSSPYNINAFPGSAQAGAHIGKSVPELVTPNAGVAGDPEHPHLEAPTGYEGRNGGADVRKASGGVVEGQEAVDQHGVRAKNEFGRRGGQGAGVLEGHAHPP